MEEINQILFMIKNNYGIYIGEKNLDRLIHVIVGYQLCAQVRDGDVPAFLPGFQRFVEQYFNLGITDEAWCDIISKNCKTDAEAFDMFYSIMELYLSN